MDDLTFSSEPRDTTEADTLATEGTGVRGILIFDSVAEAIKAGFEIQSVYKNSDGFLYARMRTATGWALALVRA
jgi:hypothetical protein